MIPAPTYFCQSSMHEGHPFGSYRFPVENCYVWPHQLELAKAFVTTGAPIPIQKDMIQWATTVKIACSDEVYLAVPHTGFCYYQNITHLLMP